MRRDPKQRNDSVDRFGYPTRSSSGTTWGWIFPQEADAIEGYLQKLASARSTIKVCEVGVYQGHSAQGFHDTAQRLGFTLEYLGIDPEPDSPPGLAGVTYQRCPTSQACLTGREFDFVFIDGDHGYDCVALDAKVLSGHVAPGGFIAFHDTDPLCEAPDVRRAVLDCELPGFAQVEDLQVGGSGGLLVYQRLALDDRIAVLVPSRGKPGLLMSSSRSAFNTSSRVDLFAYVADDDPKLAEYRAMKPSDLGCPPGSVAQIHFGPPLGYGPGTNRLWELHPGYRAYFTGEDDYEYVHPGWDQAYLDALPADGVGLVCCNILHNRTLWSGFHTVMVGGPWAAALGYVITPTLVHHFIMEAWERLAVGSGRYAQLAEVMMHHNQNTADSVRSHSDDSQDYQAWLQGGGLSSDLEKLRQATVTP